MSAIQSSVDSVLASLANEEGRRTYRGHWARFCAWLDTEKLAVLEVRPRHVMLFLQSMRDAGLARATVMLALSITRAMFSAMVRDELLAANPAREAKAPKMATAQRVPWLTEEQVIKLMTLPADSWKERRDRLCTMLGLGLGLRRAEIARMRVEDFHDRTVRATVKGGKELRAGVPTWLMSDIDAWRVFAGIDKGALLPRSETDPRSISGGMVYHAVKAVAARAGIPDGIGVPHALRRSSLTLASLEGVSLEDLQRSVAHASKVTTEKYLKASRATPTPHGEWMSRLIK